MKKYFILILTITTGNKLFAQNVGIGTTTPVARLHVKDSNVVFTGPSALPATTNFNPPLQGPGTRMMWYPQKGAFRMGTIDGVQWNRDNIGNNSFAAGFNVKATGFGSVAMGINAIALGNAAIATSTSTAQGDTSFATGSSTVASGPMSTTFGNHSIASGQSSLATGEYTIASGIISTATGNTTIASGDYSIATGNATTASGYSSTAMGRGTVASQFYSTAIGAYNNALGYYSAALGGYTTASGTASTTMGLSTTASGDHSTAMGYYTKARSANSLVIGNFNDTSNINSLFEIGSGYSDNIRRNAMTVLNNGNVGIGVNNPSYLLQTGFGGVRIEGSNGSAWSGPALSMGGYGDLSVDRSGVVGGRFIVKENGNVGIGKSNPSVKLEVSVAPSGNNYNSYTSLGIESNGPNYINLLTTNTWETGILFGNSLYNADGGIWYNTFNPAADTRTLYFQAAGLAQMKLYQSGNAWLHGSLTQASDARLKKNISRLNNPLASIEQLNGYTYNWKDEKMDPEQQIGVLAQELQKVYPQLVKQSKSGELSVNYIGLIPVLLESIKELKKEVDELKMKRQ